MLLLEWNRDSTGTSFGIRDLKFVRGYFCFKYFGFAVVSASAFSIQSRGSVKFNST